jgi:hypothetical protein
MCGVADCGAGVVADKPWEQARLIPVSGINGSDEQEGRGVSALLAVVNSVREFGRAITAPPRPVARHRVPIGQVPGLILALR